MMKFESNAGLIVNGTLRTEGSPNNKVIFTSRQSTPAAGDWLGIYFAPTSSGNTLDHVIVTYAGQVASLPHLDYAASGTNVSLDRTWSSLYVDESSITISNSVISDGRGVGVNIYKGSASITDSTISNMLSGTEVVGTATFSYNGHGVFAYNDDAPTAAFSITGSRVISNAATGVSVRNEQPPTITNNTFTSNAGAAIQLTGHSLSSASGNNFATGNGINGIAVDATISADTTWPYSNIPYILNGVTVNKGTTLALMPGQILKFAPTAHFSAPARLNVQGTLLAQGTASNQIIFTSLKDDTHGGDTNNDSSMSLPAAGDWSGMYFASTSTGNLLENAVVTYAGQTSSIPHSDPAVSGSLNYSQTWSSLYVDGGSLMIRNSTVASGLGVGVNVYLGTATINNSSIVDMRSGSEVITTYTYDYHDHAVYNFGGTVNTENKGSFRSQGNTWLWDVDRI
ncbi:MAG TPA: right-handed parallel beta-helix repeat-containing protein [Chloroflexia bacterium]|nr:right-handed parallel beta-helix repeat-containing protein [Chloroflexia bacterium]